jgi:soluble lytic murein transglycosylase-like protein
MGIATSRVGAGMGALLLAAAPIRTEVLAHAPVGPVAPDGPALDGMAAALEPAAPSRGVPDPRARLRAWVVAELSERIPDLGEPGPAGLAAAILEESAAAGLDPVLVLAMIEVESGWDPGAVSQRGARGLMQLRPATLASEAREGGLQAADPHDPEVNVRAGIRYLARMVRQFGDDDLTSSATPAACGARSGSCAGRWGPARSQCSPPSARPRVASQLASPRLRVRERPAGLALPSPLRAGCARRGGPSEVVSRPREGSIR